jgi:hypothetical protein
MADTKVFDRADLLNIFDASKEHGDRIGSFRSKRMIGELPPTPVYESHIVYATTSASFSEKNLWLIVERDVWITNAGIYTLPTTHAYKSEGFGRLTIERGLSNSADIMRKVMEMAKEWEDIVRNDCPSGIMGEGELSEYEKQKAREQELEKAADEMLRAATAADAKATTDDDLAAPKVKRRTVEAPAAARNGKPKTRRGMLKT